MIMKFSGKLLNILEILYEAKRIYLLKISL